MRDRLVEGFGRGRVSSTSTYLERFPVQHVDRLVFTNDDGQAHAEELQRQIHEPRLTAAGR